MEDTYRCKNTLSICETENLTCMTISLLRNILEYWGYCSEGPKLAWHAGNLGLNPQQIGTQPEVCLCLKNNNKKLCKRQMITWSF